MLLVLSIVMYPLGAADGLGTHGNDERTVEGVHDVLEATAGCTGLSVGVDGFGQTKSWS